LGQEAAVSPWEQKSQHNEVTQEGKKKKVHPPYVKKEMNWVQHGGGLRAAGSVV